MERRERYRENYLEEGVRGGEGLQIRHTKSKKRQNRVDEHGKGNGATKNARIRTTLWKGG